MGTRRPYTLVDTTPAKTILVYRNGDPFYVGRKFVFSRRRVATFETLLDQLTEQIKPVVHCDLNVPSRWQAYHRVSRHVNVFTNGRLFIPPVKIIIPKFCLSDWTHVLAVIGEKVFPLGGVRKLFTMTGHLLDSSEDLQDNHFYVAAGLETFKPVPYWKSPRVPSEVQLKFAADAEKHPQRKKKEDSKAKEPHLQDGLPPKTQDSVYYAKEGARPELAGPVVRSGAEGDVYTAPTPNKEARGAPEVKEDPCMQVEVPVDQVGSGIGVSGLSSAPSAPALISPSATSLPPTRTCSGLPGAAAHLQALGQRSQEPLSPSGACAHRSV
ncbi:Doublecortin domain-containing protein 2C [Tupaia chinensis]|uniref:Doublecortin domain-containing protein 2C n=1 Tax=Tupaia chinensis TaxID=246437 RepID=L9KMF5_TUPCH|nr:Doublecortin domain-containing protein 2C [Tupaia chinensis]